MVAGKITQSVATRPQNGVVPHALSPGTLMQPGETNPQKHKLFANSTQFGYFMQTVWTSCVQ
jgi:hypothetical protein